MEPKAGFVCAPVAGLNCAVVLTAENCVWFKALLVSKKRLNVRSLFGSAGASGAETEIAGYFVTTEEPIARFVAQLPRGSDGRLPYFEALLKTRRLGQETQRYELIAYRLLNP